MINILIYHRVWKKSDERSNCSRANIFLINLIYLLILGYLHRLDLVGPCIYHAYALVIGKMKKIITFWGNIILGTKSNTKKIIHKPIYSGGNI